MSIAITNIGASDYVYGRCGNKFVNPQHGAACAIAIAFSRLAMVSNGTKKAPLLLRRARKSPRHLPIGPMQCLPIPIDKNCSIQGI